MNKLILPDDFKKIKLVIWDLDNTIWSGILSEGEVVIKPLFVDLIKKLTKYGVVNSICSKNDLNAVMEKLNDYGIKDFFVFCSVDWTNKGQRIKQIISDMNLKDKNVLFVDDENINLEEALFYSPNIMLAKPDIISDLFNSIPDSDIDKSDRLSEYRILETKRTEQKKYDSPVEFLEQSNILVKISHNCLKHIDRIHELITRTNQLNFTKNRIDFDVLKKTLKDKSIKCGYVECADKYGYYGIIGFFAVLNGQLIHYTFSCRCLGMRVEQFIYQTLGFPTINIVGETAVTLSCKNEVTWIKLSKNLKEKKTSKTRHYDIPAVFKGPCDIEQLFAFIHDSKFFIKEFNYVSRENKCNIYQGTHSTTMVQSIDLDESSKNNLKKLPFYDKDVFKTNIYTIKNGLIFISLLPEGNYALYQSKKTGIKIVFGEHCDNLTDDQTIELFLNNKIWTGDFNTDISFFKSFKEEYSYLGRIPIDESCSNYKRVISHIDKSNKIYLLLPSDLHVETNQPAYKNREIYHCALNTKIQEELKLFDNVYFIKLVDYAKTQNDYTNNINHFTKNVYYKLAEDIINIFNQSGEKKAKKSSWLERIYRRIKHKIQEIFNR